MLNIKGCKNDDFEPYDNGLNIKYNQINAQTVLSQKGKIMTKSSVITNQLSITMT